MLVAGKAGPSVRARSRSSAFNCAARWSAAGRLISPATLLRFYVFHCIFIPLIAAVLMIVHFWRVRKDGGISGPL